MKGKLSSGIKITLSVLLAAVLLHFAFRGTDWKGFAEGLACTRWVWIAAAAAAGYAALILRAERWRLQLAVIDPQADRRTIWHGSNIGNFLSLILPGSGEFVRCAYVSSPRSPYERTFGTIIVERAWDMIAVILLMLAALVTGGDVLGPFVKNEIAVPLMSRIGSTTFIVCASAAAVLLTGFIIAAFALRHKVPLLGKCAGIISGIAGGIKAFAAIDRKMLFLLCTAGIWVMYILMTYFTLLAVPELDTLGFTAAVFISATGNIASVIPTPGNLGAYHYLVGLTISNIYLGSAAIKPAALLGATLSHGAHALLLIILGVISYICTLGNKPKHNNHA